MFGRKNNGITEDAVRKALSTVQEPELYKDLITLNMVRDITISDDQVGFTIVLTTPACPLRSQMENESIAAVKKLVPGVNQVNVRFDAQVRTDKRIAGKLNIPVKNIIAVASGKGGVGKSTVSTNLAVSLALEGAKVGVLDADIYGPNIPMMFGLSGKPRLDGNKMVPFTAFGVEVISMGFLVPEGKALVWRGPMLHKAIQQLFTDVRWGELDYLIVDLPPGTGDAQLSLAQSVPLTGGVIVTGPQAVAVSDALRGAEAFQQLQVPIIGVIENMSGEIFGSGGGEGAAIKIGAEFLGRVDLDARVRSGGDTGKPIVLEAPESEAAKSLRSLARKIAARISVMTIEPDPELRII
ncbi:MAG: Mrp/NBP35 family ATP-binding protein [Chloroflexi bacterium]|nr:Mrp/NBP35 family ATP-binding protein [Chloroflexota bacterium]